jgi:post-segregation antitoxin (ccd killing protein)
LTDTPEQSLTKRSILNDVVEQERLWKIENKDAIEWYSRYIDEHGLTLAAFSELNKFFALK